MTCANGPMACGYPECSCPPSIPVPSNDVIERQARKAAEAGVELRDACPYPFHSDAGRHFIATYLVSIPKA